MIDWLPGILLMTGLAGLAALLLTTEAMIATKDEDEDAH